MGVGYEQPLTLLPSFADPPALSI
eukprot:SAG22_NODE_8349_length_662_cov_1.122558_2_plen_23_part_01